MNSSPPEKNHYDHYAHLLIEKDIFLPALCIEITSRCFSEMVLRSVCCRRLPAYFRRECSTFGHWDTAQFKPKKAVILTKVSRYEFEKLRHDNLSEAQLEQELTARGSNYAAIRHHHNIHKVEIELVTIDSL